MYVLMINQSVYKLVDDVYDSSYCALQQSKVENDNKDTMLLSIVHEISLCLWEFSILLVFLIISVVNGIQIEFEFEKIEVGTKLQGVNFENYKFNRKERIGSPPS